MSEGALTVPTPQVPREQSLRSGVDVVSIERIARLLDEFGASFKRRAFTQAERTYCERRGHPPQHYAARWAVKEAFLKAVTDDVSVPTRSVGVVREGERPSLSVTDEARRALAETAATDDRSGVETAVSLSHDRAADRAVGQVVLLGGIER